MTENRRWDDWLLFGSSAFVGIALGINAFTWGAPIWVTSCFSVVVFYLCLIATELGVARRRDAKREEQDE